MKIHIFDVEHGDCSVIEMPSGKVMMIDCGHNVSTDWRPSSWIVKNGMIIDNLTITNIDEDHVSDLPNVIAKCKVMMLTKNRNITPNWVKDVKRENGMGNGVQAAVEMMERYIYPCSDPDWGGAIVTRFWHSLTDFNNENNLSVVTFIKYEQIGIVFAGDLLREGWEKFLENENFKSCLRDTNIFVASHHGREDGYCEAVFNFCKPEIVIISDKEIMYDTQDVNYGRHASGIAWPDGRTRKVLTTRCDGKIEITRTLNGAFITTPNPPIFNFVK